MPASPRPEFTVATVRSHAFGYKQVCLDSAPFIKAAHRIYEDNGFVDRPHYEGVEAPPELHDRWRFMERAL